MTVDGMSNGNFLGAGTQNSSAAGYYGSGSLLQQATSAMNIAHNIQPLPYRPIQNVLPEITTTITAASSDGMVLVSNRQGVVEWKSLAELGEMILSAQANAERKKREKTSTADLAFDYLNEDTDGPPVCEARKGE
jgi:hypothetical protein